MAATEAHHLMRSPAILVFLALSSVFPLVALEAGQEDSLVRYKVLVGAGCVVLAVGTAGLAILS